MLWSQSRRPLDDLAPANLLRLFLLFAHLLRIVIHAAELDETSIACHSNAVAACKTASAVLPPPDLFGQGSIPNLQLHRLLRYLRTAAGSVRDRCILAQPLSKPFKRSRPGPHQARCMSQSSTKHLACPVPCERGKRVGSAVADSIEAAPMLLCSNSMAATTHLP